MNEKQIEKRLSSIDISSGLVFTLVQMRKKKNISQKEVADKIGVCVKTISRFENLYDIPKLDFVISYSDAIGINDPKTFMAFYNKHKRTILCLINSKYGAMNESSEISKPKKKSNRRQKHKVEIYPRSETIGERDLRIAESKYSKSTDQFDQYILDCYKISAKAYETFVNECYKYDISNTQHSVASSIVINWLKDKPMFPIEDSDFDRQPNLMHTKSYLYTKEEALTLTDIRYFNGIFRHTYKDGHVEYIWTDRIIFHDTYGGKDTTWHNGFVNSYMNKYILKPITMPFVKKQVHVYGEDLYIDEHGNDATNENIGTYNETVIHYAILEDGKRLDINVSESEVNKMETESGNSKSA